MNPATQVFGTSIAAVLIIFAVASARAQAIPHYSKPAAAYAANCAGCHGTSGRSASDMPTLVDRIGYFVRIPDGRAYLAQVPGIAMSVLHDDELAQMLNWLLRTYSAEQLPADFQEYTGEEIAQLRKTRIDPWVRRPQVIQALLAAGQIPSADVLK